MSFRQAASIAALGLPAPADDSLYPSRHPNLPLGDIMYLPSNHFVFMLGKGMVGSVYQLSADQEGEEQVVKTVDKSRTREIFTT